MIRVLIPVLILAVAVVVIAARRGGGLVRGMAGDMLVSPARPAVGVLPASLFHLAGVPARRLSAVGRRAALRPCPGGFLVRAVRCRSARNLRAGQPCGAARRDGKPVPLDCRQRRAGRCRRGRDGTQTPPRIARYHGRPHGVHRPALTRSGAAWQEGSLARRFTFPLFQDKARLVVEYREPYGPLLAAARRRGEKIAVGALAAAERNMDIERGGRRWGRRCI